MLKEVQLLIHQELLELKKKKILISTIFFFKKKPCASSFRKSDHASFAKNSDALSEFSLVIGPNLL
jgi:hypothetical protein